METDKSEQLREEVNKLSNEFISFLLTENTTEQTKNHSELTEDNTLKFSEKDKHAITNYYQEKVNEYKKSLENLLRQYPDTKLSLPQQHVSNYGVKTYFHTRMQEYISHRNEGENLIPQPHAPEYTYLSSLQHTLYELIKPHGNSDSTPQTRPLSEEKKLAAVTQIIKKLPLNPHKKPKSKSQKIRRRDINTPLSEEKKPATTTKINKELPVKPRNELKSESQKTTLRNIYPASSAEKKLTGVIQPTEALYLKVHNQLKSINLWKVESWYKIKSNDDVDKVINNYMTCRDILVKISIDLEKILPAESKKWKDCLEGLTIPQSRSLFRAQEAITKPIYSTLFHTLNEIKEILGIRIY